MYVKTMLYTYMCTVLLISLYGAPLTQRASYLALHGSLFGPAGMIMIMLSLTLGSRCIPNGTHTNHY